MKTLYIILILAVAIAAVVFALQNSAPITVQLLAWSVSGSLSLVLIITLVAGFLLGVLVMAPSIFKRGRQSSGLKKKINQLEKEKVELDKAAAECAELGAGVEVEKPEENPVKK